MEPQYPEELDYLCGITLHHQQGLLADDAKSAGWEEYAKMAYHIADAMVKESNNN
jgi:hypothetical protein